MTHVRLRYDKTTNRIKQSYWATDRPQWADSDQKGTGVTTTDATADDRDAAIQSALDSVEAGTDYDPDIETPVAHLCYDPDNDALYAEVEIVSLSS